MNNDIKLIEALRVIANDYWRPDAPIYLSNIPRILNETLPDFRVILGDRSLRNFAKATEKEGGYEVIVHSTESSRIVLAPAAKQFKFSPKNLDSSVSTLSTMLTESSKKTKTKTKTLDFIECLAQLSEQDQSQVVIPTNILIKLLSK